MNACFVLRGLRKTYTTPGGDSVGLAPLSVDIPWGARVGVLGHSGAGKSTLLHLLALLDEPDAAGGDVLYRDGSAEYSYLGRSGTPVRRVRDRLLKRDFGFVFQSGHLLDHLTCAENVALKLNLDGVSATRRRERAARLLADLGLDPATYLHRKPYTLSGGQAQRVAVGRAIASAPRVVFADEPTGNLDRTSAAAVLALLRAWQEDGSHGPRTLLLVTHQIDDAWEHCTHFLVLRPDRGEEVRLVPRAELAGVAELAALLHGDAPPERAASASEPEAGPPAAAPEASPGRMRWRDLLRLAWGDLTRREHLTATLATAAVLLFLLVLVVVGLAFAHGQESLVRRRLEQLDANALVADGSSTPTGTIPDALAAELEGLTLADGRRAFPPELGGVHRWNLPLHLFYLHGGSDDAPGDVQPSTLLGRTIQADDPELGKLAPSGFSSPQAAEIVVTRDFLTRLCQAPETARVVWLQHDRQPVPLRVVAVVERIRGGYPYVLPDGFDRLLKERLFQSSPLVRGIVLAGLPADLELSPDHRRWLAEEGLELVPHDAGRVLQVTQGARLSLDAMRGLGRAWLEQIEKAHPELRGKLRLEELPREPVRLPPEVRGKYSRATLHVRDAVRDAEEIDGLLHPLRLSIDPAVLESIRVLRTTVEPMSRTIWSFVGLAVLVGLGNLWVTMAQRIHGKRAEIGILRACGMTVRRLVALYMLAAVLLMVPTTLLAAALGGTLAWDGNRRAVAAGGAELFALDPWGIALVAATATATAALVCGWVAWRTARVPPARAVA